MCSSDLKKYGEIVVPVLKVVGWTPISVSATPAEAQTAIDEAEYVNSEAVYVHDDASGSLAPAAVEAKPEAPAESERRRRRRE